MHGVFIVELELGDRPKLTHGPVAQRDRHQNSPQSCSLTASDWPYYPGIQAGVQMVATTTHFTLHEQTQREKKVTEHIRWVSVKINTADTVGDETTNLIWPGWAKANFKHRTPNTAHIRELSENGTVNYSDHNNKSQNTSATDHMLGYRYRTTESERRAK